MRAETIVDELPGRCVLVLGSLPPGGRDLDLLVVGIERQVTIDALVCAGFEQGSGALVRFRACGAEPVELVDAESLELPPAELAALWAEAVPIQGFRRLTRPGPSHAVLLLALAIAHDGRLTGGRRERLEQALREDPRAFTAARARASSWGAGRAVRGLERAHAGGPLGRAARAGAVAERRRATGVRRARARLGGWRTQLPRRRRGLVVALSGLDGAGKSSQAAALAATLEQLGRPATVAWTRVGWDDELDRFAVALRGWLDALVRLAPTRGGLDTAEGTASSAPATQSPVSRLRRRSALLTQAWTVVVALFNVLAHRRAVGPQLREGKAVICDRYALDSVVGLRDQYGDRLRLRVARALLRFLSPTPRAAFFLDVPAATAFARKGEQTVEALARQRELYREEVAGLGVIRLDGERPRPELCAEIARRVWNVLT